MCTDRLLHIAKCTFWIEAYASASQLIFLLLILFLCNTEWISFWWKAVKHIQCSLFPNKIQHLPHIVPLRVCVFRWKKKFSDERKKFFIRQPHVCLFILLNNYEWKYTLSVGFSKINSMIISLDKPMLFIHLWKCHLNLFGLDSEISIECW